MCKSNRKSLLLVFLSITWILSRDVLACKCGGGSIKANYRRADLVIVGVPKVDNSHRVPDAMMTTPIRFQIKSVIKGKPGDTHFVSAKRALDVNVMCQAFLANSDDSYLVFLTGDSGVKGFTLLSDCYASQYKTSEDGQVVLDRGVPEKSIKLEDLRSELY